MTEPTTKIYPGVVQSIVIVVIIIIVFKGGNLLKSVLPLDEIIGNGASGLIFYTWGFLS